jgi:hypothetical protein
MRTVKITDDNIVTVLSFGSWVLLAVMSLAGWLLVSPRFAVGILAGGVLAIANFYWLQSILRRTLLLAKGEAQRFAMSRYMLRLALIGVTVWFMITHFNISLIGLLIGLSVLVFNIFALTIYRLISKGG